MTRFVLQLVGLCCLLVTSGCTGLVAGPESQSTLPVPASRDSAYVRARRALTGESFTVDLADSTKGLLIATRWPSSSAVQGSSTACHVKVAMKISGDASQSEVKSTSQWIAPARMSDKAPTVCDRERGQVLDRLAQVLVPPPTP